MYLINLPDHTERLERMRRIGKDLGIEWTVFPGIDARRGHPDLERFDPDGILTLPEFGCFLSHRLIWETIAESEEPMAAVFEDDLHCAADLRELV